MCIRTSVHTYTQISNQTPLLSSSPLLFSCNSRTHICIVYVCIYIYVCTYAADRSGPSRAAVD